MKWVKLFEDFKNNNEEGSLITHQDMIDCIKHGGVIYATIIKNFPNNDPKEQLKAVDIDEDDLVTVEFYNKEYYVDLKNVEKIEY